MKTKLLISIIVASVILGQGLRQTTYAVPEPSKTITTHGTVFDAAKKPASGQVVVAWCGGILFFGGSDTTGADGRFTLTADSEECPMGNQLTVVVYDHDNNVLARAMSYVHTDNEISLYLGNYDHYAVPEYGLFGGLAASAAGIAAIAFARKRVS